MARGIWSGVLSFGLVSVPVVLYPATEAHRPAFHEFEKGTADRIRYQRVNERTGAEVEYSDIVKGADSGDGNYVLLDQDELDSVAPGRSRLLEIHTFVDADDIDPIYFNKTYFLGPGPEETKKPYALLREAMQDSGKAAIATFVMRGKEYLAAVRADDGLLVLETLFFADEVRDRRQRVGRDEPFLLLEQVGQRDERRALLLVLCDQRFDLRQQPRVQFVERVPFTPGVRRPVGRAGRGGAGIRAGVDAGRGVGHGAHR